jgi:hypothetical protein
VVKKKGIVNVKWKQNIILPGLYRVPIHRMVRGIRTRPRIPWPTSSLQSDLHRVDTCVSPATTPSRHSYNGRVLFSARTLLFLVDPEKSCLGATVPQRRIVAQIRRTNHNRRLYTHITGADSPGSFLRRPRQTLNATKSVRNWTPNRAEVDKCGLGREPEPPFVPRERTFLSSHPVVPCGPQNVMFGRYETARRGNAQGGMWTLDSPAPI